MASLITTISRESRTLAADVSDANKMGRKLAKAYRANLKSSFEARYALELAKQEKKFAKEMRKLQKGADKL